MIVWDGLVVAQNYNLESWMVSFNVVNVSSFCIILITLHPFMFIYSLLILFFILNYRLSFLITASLFAASIIN